MKRRILPILVAGALMAVGATPALGDAGPPGTTFPEQPGSNLQNACVAVTSNPGTSPGGVFDQNVSPIADEITNGILVDACVPGH